MNFPVTIATILLTNYDCGAYGSGDYSGTCQTTTSSPAASGSTSTDSPAPITSSQPNDSTDSFSKSSLNGHETTTQAPADNASPAVGQAIESTPYAILIPIILGIAILIGAFFILIRRIVRRP